MKNTVHLQSVGSVPAIPASEVKPGDVRMYNFGSTSLVVNVFEKTEKTLVIVTYNKEENKYYASSARKTSLIPIIKRDQDVSGHNPTEAIDYRAGKKIVVKIPQVKKEEQQKQVTEVAVQQEEVSNTDSENKTKIPVKSIEFVWSEASCVKDNTIVKTFAEANAIIMHISAQASPEGGYNKTQIKLTFEDGNTYSFRYDVQYSDPYGCDLSKRIMNALTCYAGLRKPTHMTENEYSALLKMYNCVEQSLHLLEMYLFEDVKEENNDTKQKEVTELTTKPEQKEASKQEEQQGITATTDENGFIVLSNEDAKKLEQRYIKGQISEQEETLLKNYHLQLQERAMNYKAFLPSNYEQLIDDNKMYEVVSTFSKDGRSAGIYTYEIDGKQIKNNLWAGVYILDILTPLETVTEASEQTEEAIQEKEESINTVTAATVTLNQEKNGIEIKFNDKPVPEIIEQLNLHGFRWSKYQKIWYAKQTEERLFFAQSLTSQEVEEKAESHFSYPEIDIDDINSYTVDQALQDREHDSAWIFRKNKTDRSKEIQEFFTHYNERVTEVLSETDNKVIIYKLKKNLQSFKKRYFDNYIKRLSHKANNPHWAVTGRGGLNTSRYNKMQDRYDNLMREGIELTNWIDKQIRNAKSSIQRDKEQQVRKIADNTTIDIQFKTEKKEINGYGFKSSVRVYVYGEYMIAKLWGCFRIYKSGQEIHSMKTTQKLEDAKRYVAYLIQQEKQVI